MFGSNLIFQVFYRDHTFRKRAISVTLPRAVNQQTIKQYNLCLLLLSPAKIVIQRHLILELNLTWILKAMNSITFHLYPMQIFTFHSKRAKNGWNEGFFVLFSVVNKIGSLENSRPNRLSCPRFWSAQQPKYFAYRQSPKLLHCATSWGA